MTTDRTGHPDRNRRAVRVFTRCVLALGIAASVAANMLAAEPTLTGRVIAAWPPAALLLAVDLITRIPVTSIRRSVVRLTATATVAVIAAWVSYGHMAAVAAAHGETQIAARLLPLSVDGLIIVATLCLIDLNHPTQPTAPTQTRAPALVHTAATPPRTRPTTGGTTTRPAPPPGLGAALARLRAEHPTWTQTELATAAGCSVRTVRRHTPTTPHPKTEPQPQREREPQPQPERELEPQPERELEPMSAGPPMPAPLSDLAA